MLDTNTKKRIDDCRDILVGKLPDPKAQIEQITIGLIYKFMDDMDKESIELGGVAKFFSGNFTKYNWDALFNSKVTAADMLKLYSEAIESMENNPNIPQLFRDIFNSAYLPYRDPETLKLFLKTIGEFEYTHSEMLGDAFEYLLSVMGSQGDAGQFRTPRHIIDFLVAVVDPQKSDTILDPACGTAGFLISAFKYIKANNYNKLTPEEQRRLIQNFVGYDISPDMVRLSLVNLYLHGFANPHIWEYDTLSSEERWNETYDVILANPPFMSPKGGIRPHKKFSISSNRSEVLFVDYIAEHLNPKGRAGIIVPEGIIFQSGKAYKDLRRMLVQNYLYAVVSLPAGVFNPYSGVKTSILLMDKEFAKTNEEILFVKIDNDGYGLGAQRNAVKGSQLEEAVQLITNYKLGITNDEIAERSRNIAHIVPKAEIAKNGDYNLSGERYKIIAHQHRTEFALYKLSEIAEIKKGSSITKDIITIGDIPVIAGGQQAAYYHNTANRIGKTITVSSSGAYAGFINYFEQPIFASDCTTIQSDETRLKTRFLFRILKYKQDEFYKLQKGGAQPHVYGKEFGEIQIPLPPLSVQEEIVTEIESFQKIIDGAKMVVENYKPKIDIDAEWEMVELQSICTKLGDGLHGTPEYSTNGEYYFINGNNLLDSKITIKESTKSVSIEEYAKYKKELNDRTILVSINGTLGNVAIYNNEKVVLGKSVCYINLKKNLNKDFIKIYLQSANFLDYAHRISTGSTIQNVSLQSMKSFNIPLPPLETQRQIVAQIEKEQELVNANKQLIKIFEQKIKERIGKVWGER